MKHEAMKASTDRLAKSKHAPTTYGFEGETVAAATLAMSTASASDKVALLFKLGLKEDGTPEGWVVVKVNGKTLYVGNVSYTCPPRPPEDCE